MVTSFERWFFHSQNYFGFKIEECVFIVDEQTLCKF